MRSILAVFAVFVGATLIGISHAVRLAPGPELPLDRIAASLLLCTVAGGSVILLWLAARELHRWRRADTSPAADQSAEPSMAPGATTARTRRTDSTETIRSEWQGRPRRRPLRLVRSTAPSIAADAVDS